jgi:hypothetical protein
VGGSRKIENTPHPNILSISPIYSMFSGLLLEFHNEKHHLFHHMNLIMLTNLTQMGIEVSLAQVISSIVHFHLILEGRDSSQDSNSSRR